MPKTELIRLDGDIVEIFKKQEAQTLQMSSKCILDILVGSDSALYSKIKLHNINDALRRLEDVGLLVRLEKGGSDKVLKFIARKLNMDLYNLGIKIVEKRKRKKNEKREDSDDNKRELVLEKYQPDETVEAVRELLGEETLKLAVLHQNYNAKLRELQEFQRRARLLKEEIDEAEFELEVKREIVSKAMESFTNLKNLKDSLLKDRTEK